MVEPISMGIMAGASVAGVGMSGVGMAGSAKDKKEAEKEEERRKKKEAFQKSTDAWMGLAQQMVSMKHGQAYNQAVMGMLQGLNAPRGG